MSAPFGVEARSERASVSSGKSTLWASIRVAARGEGLETDRAPLAVALVIDVSPSMAGEPLAHALRSAEIVCELLSQRDHLAIVTFSHDARVLCGLTRCDDDGKNLVRVALRSHTAESSPSSSSSSCRRRQASRSCSSCRSRSCASAAAGSRRRSATCSSTRSEIEASEGFVRNDGSELAECREQLEDEAANYERTGSQAELAHQK
jgi:hypothetical protein